MKNYLEILKKCPLFIGIADDHILKMLSCLGAKVVEFDKKYTIFAEGNPAKFIGIMLSGSAQIIRVDYFGNRSIVSSIEQGEMFAESFACAEMKAMPVSVIASEDCKVMLIDCSHILYTCVSNCGFHQNMIFNLMKNLANKNIMFHQRIEITSNRTTREKLLSYLNFCAKKANSNEFDIPFDRQELADYLEVERSGLSAEISKLRDEGILKSNKNHFELLA